MRTDDVRIEHYLDRMAHELAALLPEGEEHAMHVLRKIEQIVKKTHERKRATLFLREGVLPVFAD
jgi:hypothetical protein